MRVIRKIFTIDNVILGFAVGLFFMSIRDIRKAYANHHKLITHIGIVQEKRMISTVDNGSDAVKGDSLRIIKIKLENDEKEYSISYSALAVNTLVNNGDSVELFTIDPVGKGNLVIGSDGNKISYSSNPNEVFQIFSKKYPTPVVDYSDYVSSVRTTVWVIPSLSLICFIWYFFRRSNTKGLFSFYIGKREIQIG